MYTVKSYDNVLTHHMYAWAERFEDDSAMRFAAASSSALESSNKHMNHSMIESTHVGVRKVFTEYSSDGDVMAFRALHSKSVSTSRGRTNRAHIQGAQ